MSSREPVEVSLDFRKETAGAYAFYQGDTTEDEETGEIKEVWIWLPKSQVSIESRKGELCTVSMPEWIAQEKGLI